MRDSIIETIGFSPSRDRYKVFVIDEVHMLSTPAFNALLKTIEEPPERVVFIMATTEQHKVPETILSRCQQFEFRTIATAKILERLRLIAEAEKISIPDEALREIARSGEGSMRDAQSALDQVISFAGTEIKKEDVELALGVAGADILIRVVKGIAENQPAEALAVVDDVVMRGHDLRNFCRDLLAHFRDLLVTKVSRSEELLESAICDRAELERQAALFSESDLVRFFHSLSETETLLKNAAHPRYQVEVGLVKLMEMRRLEPIGGMIERLTALEESLRTGKAPAVSAPAMPAKMPSTSKTSSASRTGGGPEASAARSTAVAASASTTGSYAAAGTKTALETEALALHELANDSPMMDAAPYSEAGVVDESEVGQIKSALGKRRKMFLVTALEGARNVALESNELCLEFAPESRHLRDTLAKSENVKILREVCKEVTGQDLGVRFVVTDGTANEDAPLSKEETARREQQSLREQAEKDPTVQQMLRTFRGEIVDVKRAESDS